MSFRLFQPPSFLQQPPQIDVGIGLVAIQFYGFGICAHRFGRSGFLQVNGTVVPLIACIGLHGCSQCLRRLADFVKQHGW